MGSTLRVIKWGFEAVQGEQDALLLQALLAVVTTVDIQGIYGMSISGIGRLPAGK
ncbi:MAG: hypothetical protein HC835_16005 [Oscillatoriales cyanobacterium RM2_1_1]|nr:hypothetical protein [Oscillatoriales cyanobacterium SM2_3_0]NJO46995.1 hypothetical protein [Oscillatoriales cyanobacterium RM2_1_1]